MMTMVASVAAAAEVLAASSTDDRRRLVAEHDHKLVAGHRPVEAEDTLVDSCLEVAVVCGREAGHRQQPVVEDQASVASWMADRPLEDSRTEACASVGEPVVPWSPGQTPPVV